MKHLTEDNTVTDKEARRMALILDTVKHWEVDIASIRRLNKTHIVAWAEYRQERFIVVMDDGSRFVRLTEADIALLERMQHGESI